MDAMHERAENAEAEVAALKDDLIAKLEAEVAALIASRQKAVNAATEHMQRAAKAEATIERVKGLPEKWYGIINGRIPMYLPLKAAKDCADELQAALKEEKL